MNWDIELGQKIKRTDVHARFGGQRQSGISTPARSKNILVFSNASSGAKFGYDLHEGMREDGSFAYTGHGRSGDQRLLGGNKVLAESAETGKIVRLFETQGTIATYVGAFTLGDPAFEMRKSPDAEGQPRSVFVFNLVPVNADLEVLKASGGKAAAISANLSDWQAPDWSAYVIRQSAKSEDSTGSRVEFELQSHFGNWLMSEGHSVKNLTIRVGGSPIFPDIFDETTNTLIEAKKSAARGYVRTAIGQVLDYQNNERRAGNVRACAILLPSAPEDDLITLCSRLEIVIFLPLDPEDFSAGFTSVPAVY